VIDFLSRTGEFAHFTALGLAAALASIPCPVRWLRPFYAVFIGGIPILRRATSSRLWYF